MDVFHPSVVNETSDYSYEDYYNLEAMTDYGPCMKPQARTFSQAFLPGFYSVTCVLSFAANFGLIAVFIKYKPLRKVVPLNMVTADLLFTVTLPFWAVYAYGEWIFGHHACKIVTLFYMVGLFGSNLFVGCTILQRCVDMSTSAAGRRMMFCGFLWLLSILAAAPHLYFVEAHEFQGQKICTNHFAHRNGWRIYMRFQMIVLGFCAPLLVLVLSFGVVFRATARRSLLPRRSRSLTLVMGFAVLFLVLWFPYSAVIFLHALQELHIISECVTSLHLDLAITGTECVAFTHAFLNPVVYAVLNERVRRKLCAAPRQNLLSSSASLYSESSKDSALELNPFSSPESDSPNAERQGHFLPHIP